MEANSNGLNDQLQDQVEQNKQLEQKIDGLQSELENYDLLEGKTDAYDALENENGDLKSEIDRLKQIIAELEKDKAKSEGIIVEKTERTRTRKESERSSRRTSRCEKQSARD